MKHTLQMRSLVQDGIFWKRISKFISFLRWQCTFLRQEVEVLHGNFPRRYRIKKVKLSHFLRLCLEIWYPFREFLYIPVFMFRCRIYFKIVIDNLIYATWLWNHWSETFNRVKKFVVDFLKFLNLKEKNLELNSFRTVRSKEWLPNWTNKGGSVSSIDKDKFGRQADRQKERCRRTQLISVAVFRPLLGTTKQVRIELTIVVTGQK